MKALTDDSSLVDAIAIIGIISSQIMNLFAIPSILEIMKAKNTLLYPTFPFAVSIISSIASIPYAYLSQQWLAGLSSVLTLFQNGSYELIHYHYSTKRHAIAVEFGTLLALLVVSMGSGPAVKCCISSDGCEDFTMEWFGVVMAIISCARYGSQASTFARVIRTRNSGGISPPMTAGAMFSSAVWTVYSLLKGDPYYLASGIAGLSSCVGQIILLSIYPRNLSFSQISSIHSGSPIARPLDPIQFTEVNDGFVKEETPQ